ncbi:MAG: hypothetical protein ACOYB2_10915 [Limnohabitans sp.]
MKPPAKVPQPASELLALVDGFDEDALLAIGAEYRDAPVSKETLDALAAWIRENEPVRKQWYQTISQWVSEFVRSRWPTWDHDADQKFIRPALEAACLASVMYAAGQCGPEVYRDALRGFHAAYAAA